MVKLQYHDKQIELSKQSTHPCDYLFLCKPNYLFLQVNLLIS